MDSTRIKQDNSQTRNVVGRFKHMTSVISVTFARIVKKPYFVLFFLPAENRGHHGEACYYSPGKEGNKEALIVRNLGAGKLIQERNRYFPESCNERIEFAGRAPMGSAIYGQ